MDLDDPGEDSNSLEINQINPSSPILETRRSSRIRSVHDSSIITGHIVQEENSSNSNDIEVVKTEDIKVVDVKCNKKRALSVSDDDDDEEGTLCPICFDYWTNSGDHRLTSLKCGHLFGHCCIKRWLKGETKNCPTCKMKAHMRDLRFIYAKTLKVQDTSELEFMKDKLDKVIAEKCKLEQQYQSCIIKLQLLSEENEKLKQCSITPSSTSSSHCKTQLIDLYKDKTIEMSSDAGCRVFSYNPHYQLLAVSQKSQGNIFVGFGVKFMTFQKNYHPSRHTEIQLWSCCWDGCNPNLFYVGGQSGTFLKFDLNNAQECLDTFKLDDMSPAISIRAVPASPGAPLPYGGVLVCTLKSCWVVDTIDTSKKTFKLPFEGSFVSLSYDRSSDHILISARPCSKFKNSRHIVATLDKVDDIITARMVHEFLGGQFQDVMSRSTQIIFNNEHYVAVYDNHYKSYIIWSMKTERKVKTLPVSNPVLDLCAAQVDSNMYLLALTETSLYLYRTRVVV
ncbi:E3 ubiquitin-protein ligase RFWD3-like [Ctenocephalides felis]|uniref:E3 ubiquitin-protein ligase RFWD3-like n=1 Tax=Ctenocephalides felis TaxID=7515 RepID=UPI000E6E17C4|nr:E3 ubiquitin-protein ligase RFWD3-like [Ctenocephalides felis]